MMERAVSQGWKTTILKVLRYIPPTSNFQKHLARLSRSLQKKAYLGQMLRNQLSIMAGCLRVMSYIVVLPIAVCLILSRQLEKVPDLGQFERVTLQNYVSAGE